MFDRGYQHYLPSHLRAAMDRLPDPEAVWEIVRSDDVIGRMRRLSGFRLPAVAAVSKELLELGDWVRRDDAKRTFGKLVRCIMEAAGYEVERVGVLIPEDPLFTKGTRYRTRQSPSPRVRTTTLTISHFGDELSAKLSARAAKNGRSNEAEALHILSKALGTRRKQVEPNLAEAIHQRFSIVSAFNDDVDGDEDGLAPHPPVSTEPPPSFEP
jgi:plasmid stability protein